MSALWSGFLGVVLGGVLTATGAWYAARYSARQGEAEARRARRANAYADFLTTCGLIVFSADSVRTLVVQRTGLREGVAVTTGSRPSLGPEEVIDLLRKDLDPLYRAWSNVWAVGSQEAITLANEILDLSADLLRTSTQGGKGRGQIASALLGHAFNAEQVKQFQADATKLAELRRDFGILARRESGEPVAQLFTNPVT